MICTFMITADYRRPFAGIQKHDVIKLCKGGQHEQSENPPKRNKPESRRNATTVAARPPGERWRAALNLIKFSHVNISETCVLFHSDARAPL